MPLQETASKLPVPELIVSRFRWCVKGIDNMNKHHANCPDCKGKMHRIKLIDATAGPGRDQEGVQHVDLAYAAPFEIRRGVSKKIAQQGKVRGMMCSECGRIILYGQPN